MLLDTCAAHSILPHRQGEYEMTFYEINEQDKDLIKTALEVLEKNFAKDLIPFARKPVIV